MWIEPELFCSPVAYTVCFTREQFTALCDELKIDLDCRPPFVPPQAHAVTHIRVVDGDAYAIVCVGDVHKEPPTYIASVLVHEAVHVWQAAMERVGEAGPSDEFMAYGIQRIAYEFMVAYHEWINGNELPTERCDEVRGCAGVSAIGNVPEDRAATCRVQRWKLRPVQWIA